MNRKHILAALAGACLIGGVSQANAAAYSFTTAPISFDTQLSLGFTFTANTNFNVTSLGIFDDQGDGFLTSHDGADFHEALLALNGLGYTVDAFIIDASRFVPQSRQRHTEQIDHQD